MMVGPAVSYWLPESWITFKRYDSAAPLVSVLGAHREDIICIS